MRRPRAVSSPHSGHSVVEIVVALGLTGVLSATALLSFRDTAGDALRVAADVESFVGAVRQRSMGMTSAHFVRFIPATGAGVVSTALNCAAGPSDRTPAPALGFSTGKARARLSLAPGAPDEVCLSTRGTADRALGVTVSDGRETFEVTVARGGAVRRRRA